MPCCCNDTPGPPCCRRLLRFRCCPSYHPNYTSFDCSDCLGDPQPPTITVTLAGLSSEEETTPCDDCSILNASFTLYQNGPCSYQTVTPDYCDLTGAEGQSYPFGTDGGTYHTIFAFFDSGIWTVGITYANESSGAQWTAVWKSSPDPDPCNADITCDFDGFLYGASNPSEIDFCLVSEESTAIVLGTGATPEPPNPDYECESDECIQPVTIEVTVTNEEANEEHPAGDVCIRVEAGIVIASGKYGHVLANFYTGEEPTEPCNSPNIMVNEETYSSYEPDGYPVNLEGEDVEINLEFWIDNGDTPPLCCICEFVESVTPNPCEDDEYMSFRAAPMVRRKLVRIKRPNKYKLMNLERRKPIGRMTKEERNAWVVSLPPERKAVAEKLIAGLSRGCNKCKKKAQQHNTLNPTTQSQLLDINKNTTQNQDNNA